MEDDVVFWPTEDERQEISKRIKNDTDFPFCVGFVDGTLIPFSGKPVWQGEDFYSRKSFYCLTAMIVCDDRKMIRHCFTGYAGSSHDARVYANSDLAQNPRKFFSGEEYLLADSAYTPSREIIPAYKKPVHGEMSADNTRFNYYHSNLRVRVEHCIGILKSRFQCLKGMRVMIRGRYTCAQASLWLRTCCVLHNLLLKRGDDDWEEDECEGNQNAMPSSTGQEEVVIE